MEGNECRRLLRGATPILASVKAMLLEYLGAQTQLERARKADAAEVDLMLGSYERLFQYMDALSHFAYQPYGSLTDSDLEDVTKCVRLATKLWENLLPTVPIKVHAWQHLVDDLHRLRGLKSHNEQAIERCHQEGKKHDRRLHCFRDFKKKTENILKLMETAKMKEVQEKHEETETQIFILTIWDSRQDPEKLEKILR